MTDGFLSFIIENDGSPIDIMLSHGSNGDQVGSGKCQVSFTNVSVLLFQGTTVH